jgi:hypothetical protein
MTVKLELAPEQPLSTEIHMADGVFVKTMAIPQAGTIVPQHAHVFPHVSVLVKGALRIFQDGVDAGEFTAPFGILIPARVKHLFVSLVDDTTVLCVHDIGTAESVEIAAENHFPGAE